MWPFARHNVVIDVGSGFTKMGYAGNIKPQVVIPTCVANSTKGGRSGVHTSSSQGTGAVFDADFYIGDEAFARKDSPHYLLSYPMVKGRVDNWDDMERFMQQALFRQLRCVPEDHNFLLTETPFNTPENRELTAEIMFETFNSNGLYIAVQAVLALYGQWVDTNSGDVDAKPGMADLTGLVVDSGDGVTCAIPVADGYVVSSCIQEIPLGGKHVTQYICDLLTKRQEPVPPEQRMETARLIKEQHGYVCQNIEQEKAKYDADPKRYKTFSGLHYKTHQPWSIQIGFERFLGPEIFFKPELFEGSITTPLHKVVDTCIMNCPIDYRRRLYSNIVLSGGSTTFQNFKDRLERNVQNIVDERLQLAEKVTGARPQAIPVKVNGDRKKQLFSAWLGGSYIASEPQFISLFKTKKDYEEVGPSIMRSSAVLLH